MTGSRIRRKARTVRAASRRQRRVDDRRTRPAPAAGRDGAALPSAPPSPRRVLARAS